jgi:hypothetical protein
MKFIELTMGKDDKILVNPAQVAFITKSEMGLASGKFVTGTAILFTNPLKSNGSRIIIVRESYDEVKQKLMEG